MVSSPAGQLSSSGLGFPSNDFPPQLWTPPGLSTCSAGGASVSTRAASDGMPTPKVLQDIGWPCDLDGASPGQASASSSSASQPAAVTAPPGLARMVLDECEGEFSKDPLSDLNEFLDAQRNSSGCFQGALPGESSGEHRAAISAAGLEEEDDAILDGQLPLLLGTTAEPYCP